MVCVCRTDGAFASGGPLSIRHRVRIVETQQYTVKKTYKAVEAFLWEWHIYQLTERGLILDDLFVVVSPLFVPATRVTVPSFIPNEVFKKRKVGWLVWKVFSWVWSRKDACLQHVQSVRWQALCISIVPFTYNVKFENGFYTVVCKFRQHEMFWMWWCWP